MERAEAVVPSVRDVRGRPECGHLSAQFFFTAVKARIHQKTVSAGGKELG